MSKIIFKINEDIFNKHPGYKRIVIIASNVSNNYDLKDELNKQIDNIKNISIDDERIMAWRDAFMIENMKTRDFRPSIDALVRRIKADKPIGSINTIVDTGTIISLKYILPAGSHPIFDDTKEIYLDRAAGNEIDVTLDGKTEIVPADEIILKDTDRIATRRWVWRQTPLSRISESTDSFFLNIDILPIISNNEMENIIKFSKDLIESTFNTKTIIIKLDAENSTETVMF